MIGRASPSQRRRSGNPDPNSNPKSSCSSSNHAPPMPRIARPLLMWSSVVAILAVSVGARKRVRADHEPDADPRRGLGPGGQRQPALEVGTGRVADDGVEVVPRPERVVAQLVGPDPGLEQRMARPVYWFQQSAPILTSGTSPPLRPDGASRRAGLAAGCRGRRRHRRQRRSPRRGCYRSRRAIPPRATPRASVIHATQSTGSRR